MQNNHKTYIDITKGVAIIMVLFSHLLTKETLWFYYPLLVGVFFAVAGYTFNGDITFRTLVAKKSRRLLLPYLLFSLFFVGLGLFVHQGNVADNLLGALYSRYALYPLSAPCNRLFLDCGNSPTWFLTALFVSFLLFWPLVKAKRRTRNLLMVLYLLTAYTARLLPILAPWSIDSAPLFALLMYGGYSFKSQKATLLARITTMNFAQKAAWGTLPLLFYLLLTVWNGYVNLSVRIYGTDILLLLCAALLGSAWLLYLSKSIENNFAGRGLSLIGRHSLTLFCTFSPVFSAIDKAMLSLLSTSLYQQGSYSIIYQTAAVCVAAVVGISCSVILKRITKNRVF